MSQWGENMQTVAQEAIEAQAKMLVRLSDDYSRGRLSVEEFLKRAQMHATEGNALLHGAEVMPMPGVEGIDR